MDAEMISAIELAKKLGKRKQTIFKIIRRLGIDTQKMRDVNRRGQYIVYVTDSDAERIQQELLPVASPVENGINESDEGAYLPSENGVFYLLALEP